MSVIATKDLELCGSREARNLLKEEQMTRGVGGLTMKLRGFVVGLHRPDPGDKSGTPGTAHSSMGQAHRQWALEV